MDENKSIHTIFMSDAEKTKLIVENVFLMLLRRVYIDKEGNKHSLVTGGDFEEVQHDVFKVNANNGETYVLKIIFNKISSTGKQSAVSEFIKDYADMRKIVVAREFNSKIEDYFKKNNTQIFTESSMLSDILKYPEQPANFEILSPLEAANMKTIYNVSEYTIPKYNHSDPIVKYFGIKKGTIVKITRNSTTSGVSIMYRIVH